MQAVSCELFGLEDCLLVAVVCFGRVCRPGLLVGGRGVCKLFRVNYRVAVLKNLVL